MINCVLRRVTCVLCAFVTLVFMPTARAQSPTTTLLQTRLALHTAPLPEAQLVAAQRHPSDYLGQTFEIAGQVGGFVTVDGVRTVLLTADALSFAARLSPTVPAAAWMTSGETVRALVRVEKIGNDTSLSNITLLAAAPALEMAELERAQAMRTSLSSRSLSFADQRSGGMRAIPGMTVVAPAGLSPRAQAIYAPYWSAVRGMNSRLSTADVDKITSSILYFSDQNDIDPRLIMAMIICESGFDIHSTSRTGAMGLGQLMPSTARGLGVSDPYDPVQNIAASVRLLRGHLDKYGGAPSGAGVIPFNQIALTMAAYNAGSGAVRKYHGVPPYRETRRYIAKVTALYKKMCGMG